MEKVAPLEWKNHKLVLIDQRKLPHEVLYHEIETLEECHEAIKVMIVRGAPLIGFSALYGMLLWLKSQKSLDLNKAKLAGNYLKTARPTAVNLAYEVDRSHSLLVSWSKEGKTFEEIKSLHELFCAEQMKKLHDDNMAMAKFASADLEKRYGERPLNIMTLCNTGYLACGPMGTALGVIEYLHSLNRINHVYASETRPYLQGSRLTAFELSTADIPHSITVEGAFSYLMREKLVDAIFIGADRIVENGDTANKVGSSTLSIVAKHYEIPFYVVAPISSFDLDTKNGDGIEIELRPEDEVLSTMEKRIAPVKSKALNPSFDVTDHRMISGIICENGLITDIKPASIRKVVEG